MAPLVNPVKAGFVIPVLTNHAANDNAATRASAIATMRVFIALTLPISLEEAINSFRDYLKHTDLLQQYSTLGAFAVIQI